MPFEISNAPEHFQKHINEILSGLPGIVCLIDDIFVYGSTPAEHDKHLQAVLEWIQSADATFNMEKCEFSKGDFIQMYLKFIIFQSQIGQGFEEKTGNTRSNKNNCMIISTGFDQ